MLPRKIALAVAVTATLGAASSTALAALSTTQIYAPVVSTGNNFTMLSPVYDSPTNVHYNGYAIGGTNDVSFSWSGSLYTASSDYIGPGSVSNATISSPQAFFGVGKKWTAHDVQIFAPGTYTFNTAAGAGNPESGTMTMTVGAGQLGAHMLFDWPPGGFTNIDVAVVFNAVNGTNASGVFGAGCETTTGGPTSVNCLWTGANNTVGNTAATTWMLNSIDPNGDGTMGIPMAAGGPFPGYNANFNFKGTLTPVPVPAAAWLFGSGLLGLVGIARRKKKNSA